MGELQNLIGTVLSIEGRTVTIQPHHDDLNDPLPFQCHELQKAFKSSDHVKVINNAHALCTSIINVFCLALISSADMVQASVPPSSALPRTCVSLTAAVYI